MADGIAQSGGRQGRRTSRWSLVAALLALIGLGGYFSGWHLWAFHHSRSARRALQRYDLPRARAHLSLCLEVWPTSAQTHFLAARTARRAGDTEDAERHLNGASRLGWPEGAIDLERALLQAQRGELAKVEANLLPISREDTDEAPLVLEALAQGYLMTYRLAEALHCLDRLLTLEPDHPRALVWRGEVKERRNDLAEAIRSYGRAVELVPDDEAARLRLALALTRADRVGEAAGHFQVLLARQPGNAEVLLGLARCRRSQGRGTEAREFLDALLANHPDHVEGLCEKGKLALEDRQPDAAERLLRRACALAPFDRDANYNLVQCLLHLDKKDEARGLQARLDRITADLQRAADLTRKVAAAPMDPGLRHEIGVLFLRNGQEKGGLRWLHSALQAAPGHRPTHATLAEHYQRSGQPQAAAHQRAATGGDGTNPPPEGQRQ
jgi:predicted Zn-dependent protease